MNKLSENQIQKIVLTFIHVKMKAKIITNDMSLLLGFRLGGIEGIIVEDENEISENFQKYVKEKDLALIIFSKFCYEKIKKFK